MTPVVAVAAPRNFQRLLMVEAMDGQLKVCVAGSHSPTQSALSGAKTMMPSDAVVAPSYFQSMLMVDAIDGQLKTLPWLCNFRACVGAATLRLDGASRATSTSTTLR